MGSSTGLCLEVSDLVDVAGRIGMQTGFLGLVPDEINVVDEFPVSQQDTPTSSPQGSSPGTPPRMSYSAKTGQVNKVDSQVENRPWRKRIHETETSEITRR